MQFLFRLKIWLERKNLWEFAAYVFFGQLATLANIVIHFLCMGIFHLHYMAATIISWFLANVFSFVTNKLWVFRNQSPNRKAYWTQFLRFMLFRLFALGIDMISMFILREWLRLGNGLAKVITQILVGVANYFFSKFLIFRQFPQK